jgi:Ca-activated chloride channel family protein
MTRRHFASAFTLLALASAALQPALVAQDPQTSPSETVAKPKKQAEQPEPDQEKIPSQYKKPKEPPSDATVFRADSTTVSVDVSVLDDKGHFIPKISKNYFRVSEDGVPQQISGFGLGEAPMTICMLIEFSGRFQALVRIPEHAQAG